MKEHTSSLIMAIRRVLVRAVMGLTFASTEALWAVVALLSGLPILINPASISPTSVLLLLPGFLIYGWAAGLVVGGALSLLGILMFWKRVEQAGVAVLASVALVYAIAVLSLGVGAATITAVFLILLFLTMLARYWVIGQEVKISQGKK